jgi:hypothetical protein
LQVRRPGSTDERTFTGAHPTTQQFVDQLAAWRFKRRKDAGPHILFRGPSGGTLRVLRSHLLGRADPALVDKAARMVHVTVEEFWAGPHHPADAASPPPEQTITTRPRTLATRDRTTALVLGIHAQQDRPLGFDQVVELAARRATRDQVRTASSQLCREGDLVRIRSGVYQWADGALALPQATPSRQRQLHAVPLAVPAAAPQAQPAPTTPTADSAAAQLFGQLFPSGVRMTVEILADYQQWAELTEKLAAHARAS